MWWHRYAVGYANRFLPAAALSLLTTRAFQDVNVDLEDDVGLPVFCFCQVFEVHVSPNLAHRAPGNTLSTIQEDHRFPFGLSSPGSKRHRRRLFSVPDSAIFLVRKGISNFVVANPTTGVAHTCMSEICIADDSPLTSSGKGDSNEVFPPDAALTMQEQLVNAKGGAKLYFIKGANTVSASDTC